MHLRASPIPSVRSLGYRSPAQALAVCVFIFALLSSFILWWRTSGGGHAVESSSGSAQDWPSPCDIRRGIMMKCMQEVASPLTESRTTLTLPPNIATVHPVTPYNISTALASYPRSGNTWLRTLVEKATGHLTSSLYCDRHLRRTFRSECDKTNRWLVKTHYPVTSLRRFPDPQSHFRRFDRVGRTRGQWHLPLAWNMAQMYMFGSSILALTGHSCRAQSL